jgi:cysteine synthase A
VARDYTGLIGRTPLLRLNSLAADCGATVLVKLESMEPNSVKDRPVLGMVEGAIARGEIGDDTEVVEASSGNVAFALSSVMQVKLGRKPLIFISRMHGATKARAVRISGVPVVLTSAEEGTASARRASREYAAGRQNVFHTNQHGNPDNPRAHRLTTGPELYHQCHLLTGGPPAEFVTGVGSGGTSIGVAMFREDIGADFKVIGVEPDEASLLTGGGWSAHGYSGLAPGFITDIVARDCEKLDGVERVTRAEGYAICRRLLVEEGILAGASTGASICAALRRARLPENRGRTIVTIAHDRGDRYMGIDDLYVPPESATETDVADFFGAGDAAR